MKITIILYMISLSVYASRSWAQQESAWALSANPVSISYVPKDSAMEAGLSYLIHQAALPASDQPDQTQTYRAYVSGNRKLGLLWLAGGIDWAWQAPVCWARSAGCLRRADKTRTFLS